MKKKIIFLMSMIMILGFTINVYAMELVKGETTWEEIQSDDTNAWILVEFNDYGVHNSSFIYAGFQGYVKTNTTVENYCYFYSDNNSYKIQAAYLTENGTIEIVKNLDLAYNNYTQVYKSNGGLAYSYNEDTYIHYEQGVYWDNAKVSSSNRYVFDSEDNARAYLESGSIDGLQNPDDVLPYTFDLELPQNVEVNFSDAWYDMDPEYEITWDQTDENAVNWDTEFKVYFDFAWRKAVLGISFADWNYIRNNFLENDVIKCRTRSYVVDNDAEASSEFIDSYLAAQGLSGTVATVDSYDIYMRNRYLDSSGKLHLSNWVRIEISDGTGFVSSPTESNIEVKKTELEGSVDDTTDKPDGNAVVGSVYDGSNTGTTLNQNSADLLGYISDGFGILGDNGVVALISDTLTFVPDEFWSIILIGVGLLVVIGVVKFAIG